jgi:hypothetical protein
MNHTRLVARLLNEVAAARMAVAASYMRLWRTEAAPPADAGDIARRPEPRQNAERDSMRDEGSSHDVS